MPHNRIIPTLGLALAIPLWAWAQDPAAPLEPLPGADAPARSTAKAKAAAKEPEAPPTAAETAIDEAAKKLQALGSVSADLTVTADMINQKFGLKGQYLKAPGHKVSLLLSLVGLGDATGTMLQVSDGVTLWDFTKVLNSQSCVKRSLTPILKLLDRPDCDPLIREAVFDDLGFAGPEALLKGLRKAFHFDQSRDGELDGKPALILGGTWKDSGTPVLPPGLSMPPGAPLPPYVPALVTLYLGKDDGWPYQVIFEGRKPTQIETGKRKLEEPKLGPDGRPLSRKLTTPVGKPSRLVLAYTNVKLNAPLTDDLFAFSPPPEVRPEDRTDLFVSQLQQAITEMANRKKAEAAKSSGPVLDGAVSAPAPAPAGDPPASDPPK